MHDAFTCCRFPCSTWRLVFLLHVSPGSVISFSYYSCVVLWVAILLHMARICSILTNIYLFDICSIFPHLYVVYSASLAEGSQSIHLPISSFKIFNYSILQLHMPGLGVHTRHASFQNRFCKFSKQLHMVARYLW